MALAFLRFGSIFFASETNLWDSSPFAFLFSQVSHAIEFSTLSANTSASCQELDCAAFSTLARSNEHSANAEAGMMAKQIEIKAIAVLHRIFEIPIGEDSFQ